MNLIEKIIYVPLSIILCFLPSEIFVSLWFLLKPNNFWQKLVSMCIGCIFFVPIQFVLLLLLIVFLVSCFFKNKNSPSNIKTPNRYTYNNRIPN